jgi:hypothetical protein
MWISAIASRPPNGRGASDRVVDGALDAHVDVDDLHSLESPLATALGKRL